MIKIELIKYFEIYLECDIKLQECSSFDVKNKNNLIKMQNQASNDYDCIMLKALIAISIDLNAKNVLDKSMQQLNQQVIQRKKDDILKLAN